MVVLAACQNAVDLDQAHRLRAGAVVVGANLGLSRATEQVLHLREVAVVPDFVGGSGGSASMDALFGPARCPSPEEMLRGRARHGHEDPGRSSLVGSHGCSSSGSAP